MTDNEARMEASVPAKAKKEAALSGGIIEEELVVSTEDLPDAQSIRQQEDDEWYELMDLDAIGGETSQPSSFSSSILGMVMTLILQETQPSCSTSCSPTTC